MTNDRLEKMGFSRREMREIKDASDVYYRCKHESLHEICNEKRTEKGWSQLDDEQILVMDMFNTILSLIAYPDDPDKKDYLFNLSVMLACILEYFFNGEHIGNEYKKLVVQKLHDAYNDRPKEDKITTHDIAKNYTLNQSDIDFLKELNIKY